MIILDFIYKHLIQMLKLLCNTMLQSTNDYLYAVIVERERLLWTAE